MGTVELGAYTREEALYQAIQAIVKSGEHVLRPFRTEKLGVLELGTEAEGDEEEEASPSEPEPSAVAQEGFGEMEANEQLLRSAGMFNADAGLKAKWIRELSEKITREVSEKLSGEGTSKPIPIPLE